MNQKPQAPGQWANQQKVAEKKDKAKRSRTPSQMEQSSGLQPMRQPAKQHGDKIKPRPAGSEGGA